MGRIFGLGGGLALAREPARVELALVPMRDGDRLEVEWRPGERSTLVQLLHGLGGSRASAYMQHCARAFEDAGFPVLLVDHRGSGGTPELHTVPYQTGRSEDLEDLVSWGRSLPGIERQVLVGFSLSGNTLLRLLALGHEHPAAAVAVNPPTDLDHTSRQLLAPSKRLYDYTILQSCRRWIPGLRGKGQDPPRYHVPRFSSLREFDRLYIAPVSGYRDREEYYRLASSGPLLGRISTPTILLTAADDPIVDARALSRTPRSEAIQLHVEPHGGHLGYLTRAVGGGRLGLSRWLPGTLVSAVESLIGASRTPPGP